MSQKVALVTGTSSGIGHATALALHQAGFLTYATARSTDALTELRGAGCRSLPLDVTDDASMQAAVRWIETQHGGIDVLVNNAGYGEMGPVEDVTLERWRSQFETNVFGLVRLTQLVLPGMRVKGAGCVINVSSMGGEFTTPFAGVYHASKYAVEAASDALRFELRPFGINVVIVQPGPISTRLSEHTLNQLHAQSGSPYATTMARLEKQSRQAARRGQGFGKPEQVAAVIVRAATARIPRTRYKVTLAAHLLPLMRRVLPDRTWDTVINRVLLG
ncbi:oxidoreductase [Deinococcus oregonensis]|uniref:Oxidoreductase n=1 Tax=Deinococcus oregonensis TaxID=1805970 RepID=A0ABV6B6G2_9DEIO